jgi:hypothetical protein
MRRAVVIALVILLAVGWFGDNAYRSRDVALSRADQKAWWHLVGDLTRRCVPPAATSPTPVGRDPAIGSDVSGLITIARANPHGWFPNLLSGGWQGNRVSWELTQAANGISCGRADLVARLYENALALPGGWAGPAAPAVQSSFAEAWADLQIRCVQAQHGIPTSAHLVHQDVSTMIRMNSSAPSAHLFRRIGLIALAPADNLDTLLGQCGAPAAVRQLAEAAGHHTDRLGYAGNPPVPVPAQPPTRPQTG